MRPRATLLLPPFLGLSRLLALLPVAAVNALVAFIVVLTLSALPNQIRASAQGVPTNGVAVACVDPRATILLTDDARSRRHGARWRAGVRRRGRCFTIRPGEQWERIYSAGGLVIMRKTPPEPGVPPLYFRRGSLTADASAGEAGASRGKPDPAPAAALAPQPAAPIRVEQLAPLPTPAQPAPATHPRGAAAAGPPPPSDPAPASPVPAQPARAQVGLGIPTAQPAPNASAAAGRSYAVGFVIAILLVTVLLAAAVLLMLVLLRRPPDRMQQPSPASPMLPTWPVASAGASVADRGPTADARAAVDRSVPAGAAPVALRPLDLLPLVAAWKAPAVAIDNRRQCAILLREVGWHASIQPLSDQRPANIVAERDGRLMVLHCLPATISVDEQAVEEACMAREREQADLAVIVSNGGYTAGARQLAAQIGVELLHEDELLTFAA